jgi:hypothetical protein
MQVLDRVLARRLEAAEEMPQVHHAEWCLENQPNTVAAVEEIAGGHMIFAGLGSPIGRAVGMGFSAPVTAADMDRLEDFYFSRKAPAKLDYCPLSDPSLLELTRERGYGIEELNNVLARKLDPTEKFPVRGGFAFRPATSDEALVFISIRRQSFFPDGGEPEGFDQMLSMFSWGSLTFVAEIDGQVVSTSAGLIIPGAQDRRAVRPVLSKSIATRLVDCDARAPMPPPKLDANTSSSSRRRNYVDAQRRTVGSCGV